MDNIYAFPHYYDIAFSYRDIAAEADIMEEAMAKYSKIPVQNILELACGNSPHLVELADRGYHYNGLDLSPTMLEFARDRAETHQCRAHFYQANLVDFVLDQPMDFIYIMLGSLYVGDSAQLLSHFSAVQRALKPGGLYFLDWCVDFSPLDDTQDTWVTRQDGVTIRTQYSTRLHHAGEQLYSEDLIFTIKDHGQQRKLRHSGLRRAIFPQEFVLAATKLHRFELLGWWNDWNWKRPIGEGRYEIVRPITILRRL